MVVDEMDIESVHAVRHQEASHTTSLLTVSALLYPCSSNVIKGFFACPHPESRCVAPEVLILEESVNTVNLARRALISHPSPLMTHWHVSLLTGKQAVDLRWPGWGRK